MRLHFTRNNKCGSRLIRAITGESVSHVAMEQEQFGVVMHATPTGVDIDSLEHFNRDHETVLTIEYCGGGDTRLWERRALMAEGRDYDVRYFFVLGIRLILRTMFGWAIPPLGRYMSKNKFICTEFVEFALGIVGKNEITPGQLGTYLLSTGQWRVYKNV